MVTDVNVGEERIYTIPLRKVKEIPRGKRAPRAIKEVRSFLQRHTKTDNIYIDRAVNESMWKRGIEKPPSRIRVRVTKETVEKDEVQADIVRAFLAE